MSKKNVLREIFSEVDGKLSSKRIIGTIAMFIALGSTIYLVTHEGGSTVVENLIMTILIMSASLLGLPAVTGIWGKSKMSIGQSLPKEEPMEELQESSTEVPNCDNCYYKQQATKTYKRDS